MSSNRFFYWSIAAVVATAFLLQLCLATPTDARGPTRPRSAAASRGRSPSPSSSRGGEGGGGGGGRGRGPGSSAGQISLQEQELAYYRACPQMYCREVSSSCRTVEYVAMLRQTEVRGKLVTVECRGCDYCADVPAHYLSSRSIRSGDNDDQLQLDKEIMMPCSIARCPVLPDTCFDVRLIDVLVAGQQCGQCPVCFDRNVVNVL